MGPVVRLLGSPAIVLGDGSTVALRGHKAWALLAYLAAYRGPVGRRHLARLLFEDAEDPLAALRWNLSELRRGFGPHSLRGDAVQLDRASIASIDVDVLSRGPSSTGAQLEGLGCELLEGFEFAGCPSFAVWLEAERRRIDGMSRAVLHEASLAQLAAGSPREAAQLAGRLLALDPLDENAQVHLVRCLSAAGDGVGAARQAVACRELFQRELGVLPGPALADALHTVTSTAVSRPASGRAGALAQLEAGEAAIAAGVLESGLQCLRRAIVDADATGDPALRARARVALGSALVHAARGRDAEGAAALHEVLTIGLEAPPRWLASACRELGYVEFLLGRYERSLAWVERAESFAGDDDAEWARLATLHGSVFTDMAHYDAALARLREAGIRAAEAGDGRQAIFAQSMTGRALVLTGALDEAASLLDTCIGQASRMWTALLPWPQSFRAEVDLLRGHVDRAADRFEHAFALGCQLADPCWEGVAGRGLGLVAAARGDAGAAMDLLLDTLRRCTRLPDAYVWGRAYVLDALCDLAVAKGDARALVWVTQLGQIAASAGMRELVARSHRHRAQLGERGAAEAACQLARQIRNPVLDRLMT